MSTDNNNPESLKKNGCVAFTCTLASPLVFAVYPSSASSGRMDWRIESNEEYQNKIINEINGAAQSAYDAFVYDHPEVFWLGKMSYEWKITFRREAGADNATGTIKEITFTPHEEYPGAAADTADFLAAVQNAVANIRSADGTTSVEWLRAIHNYVCTQLTYEENRKQMHGHGQPAAPFYMTTGSSARAMQRCFRFSAASLRFRVCWCRVWP